MPVWLTVNPISEDQHPKNQSNASRCAGDEASPEVEVHDFILSPRFMLLERSGRQFWLQTFEPSETVIECNKDPKNQ